MSKFAIIKIGPFQYRVEEGKEYIVPKFNAEAGKPMEVAEVLATGEGDSIEFGKPTVNGAKVTLDILEQGLGTKVRTQVYKAKSRYRKNYGFRPRITKFKVNTIALSESKTKKDNK